jgi:hypothetical protein
MATNDGGFIGQDGLNAPDSPTGVSATGGDTEATISFTAPSDVGGSAITGYRAQSNDGIGASGSSSPITVTGLTNGTSYTFNVWAINAFGYSAPSDASGSVTPALLERGFIAGGQSSTNVIQYIEIPTTGNTTDFGDLTVARYSVAAMSNVTRSVFAGGNGPSNVMDYITNNTLGNATDFGDLTAARSDPSQGSINSTTRGIIAGGYNSGTQQDIQYITIASTGNATTFGTLAGTQTGYSPAGLSSSTRGLIAGGDSSGNNNQIAYITIASTGNSTDFGDLTVGRDGLAGGSNATRGLFSQGYTGSVFSNVIDYVTIASTGNATDFGDCSTGSRHSSQMTNSTRSVIRVGANSYPYASVTLEYVTIASTGNTTDFGDLLSSISNTAGCSSSNGGVQ